MSESETTIETPEREGGCSPAHCSAPWSFVEHTWAESTVYDANDLAVCTFSIRYEATEETQEVLERRMDEQVRLVANAPALRDMVTEMVAAMKRYQMDVEDAPPFDHRDMMRRAESLLKQNA